jgi:hypothetical protein
MRESVNAYFLQSIDVSLNNVQKITRYASKLPKALNLNPNPRV